MMDLQTSRDEIDKIDKEIVKLFEERMKLSQNVAAYKRTTGKKVYDPQREMEKLESVCAMTEDTFNQQGIKELFTQIMSISRKLQYRLIDNYDAGLSFQKVDKFETTDKSKVVCFGVRGSYTEQAMEEYFGTGVESFYETSFKGVMQIIKEGKADFGVLPIENSSTGGIADIYDLLVEYDNYIIGEHVIKVQHNLLGLKGSKIEQLRRVYSHPQGLLQCTRFFEENKNIEPIEYVSSTAAAALKIKEDGDPTQGAVAGKRVAEYYNLEILKECINYSSINSTRFIVITNRKIFLEKANKVSICFELPHQKGSLYNMLSHFIYNNLNMTKIESRPIEGRRWEYRFIVEFEGNLLEAGVKNAINGIKEEAVNIKILGNFVKAEE